ncbi:hypothetical protein [Streptomyces sp. R33]|uniref:Phospholipase D-like domain-containing protein n=1 Tax=Streptomyces sp. R33 TaxID=3238629 RepID=A0AB39XW80_9ACTN
MTTGATFNDPTDPARQEAVFTHISRLIDGAVPGSSIKVSMYVLGSDWLAGRLSAAHLRGVNVEVILDSESLKHHAGRPGRRRRTPSPGPARTSSSTTRWTIPSAASRYATETRRATTARLTAAR